MFLIIETITPINRYFQHRFVFNSNDTNYTPVLYNVTINYTTLATDSYGNYNYTFIITSDCNMQGNNVYAYGTGTLTINALIYNFNRFAQDKLVVLGEKRISFIYYIEF